MSSNEDAQSHAVGIGFVDGGGLRIRRDQSTPNTEIDQQIEKASKLFEEGRAVDARKIYESLLPELNSRAPSQQLGFLLSAMSKIAAADGNYGDAIHLAEQSAMAYHQIGDAGGESRALKNKAIAELQNGAYPEAQKDLEQALALSRSGHDLENEAQVLNNLGSAYYFPGSYSEALKHYDDAMYVVEQNALAKWSDYWRQITNVNRAILFQRLGRYEKALQIYRQVDQSSKTLTASDRAHLYANLGEDKQGHDDGELEDTTGVITVVNGTSFTLTVDQTGVPLTFTTDANTQFNDGATLTVNTIVTVEGVTKSDGTLYAKEVEGIEDSNGTEAEGLITQVTGNPATQPPLLLTMAWEAAWTTLKWANRSPQASALPSTK